MTAEDTIGRFRRWGYALALCCLLLALGVSVAWAQWAPSVVTDKPDYAPGETVIVTGSGFTAGEQYDIPVIRPDGTIVKGDGSFVPGWDVVTADGVGAFTYLYQLNGVPGDYEVRVYPVGTVALQSGTVVLPSDDLLVASTTFTDAESLSQWANGPLGGPPGGGEWVNGNVNQAKAHYAEGDSVPYRLILTGVPLGSHEVIIEWDTTKSGKHALDYITSWDRTASEANPCLGVPGCGPGVSSSFPIPQDPNVPFAQIPGNITIYNGTITGLSGYTLNGSYAGDSSTRVTIYFTNSSTTVVLAWGGHIGSRLDWGIGNSASAVSGSPYHMRFKGLDGKGGNMDRSLAAAAVYYFEVAVEKTGDAISKVGDTVNYTFTITNNSDSDSPALTLQSVTDVGTGWPGLGDLTAVASSSGCGTLTPGASCTFGASYTVAAGDPDPLQNTVTAIYYPVGAPANTVQHSDSHSVDLVHPSISVTKSADAATAFVGQVVTYTITVQNTSPDVDLVNLTVSDSLIGDLSADFVDELPIGASETNTYQRTVLATDPDPLVNTVTVHANPRGLPNDISDTDSASVDLVAAQISIEKATNGYDADDTPGPEIVVGDPVTWTYVVTNTGEVALIGITVLDDQGVAVTCPKTVLAVGESMTCTAAGTATAGQYGNVGTVTGSYNGHTVTDSDPSHYFGADPRIQVEKELSQTGTGDWEDVDSPPGPGLAIGSSVYFRFVVTNTGNVTLDNIALSDSVYDTSGCSLPASLAPGGSFTCVIGPLSVEAGLHTNTATASGERGEDSYSDTDDANYTGVMVAIDIEKATNGEDADVAPGPMIAEGDPVSWTYVVTNTGQVRVSDIVVVDDRGVSVSCPKSELDAGESMVCSASGTAVVGQYGNVGTVTGWYCGSWEVSDSDPSHYMGIANEPAIDIEKATNGEDADDAPGPVILVGDPVSWTYVVTNAGNVTLTGITVEDDVLGLVSCPGSQLEPGQSMTCAASGIATAGQYENVGTVRAYFGQEVLSDSDPSHYFGAEPGIGVAKYVSVDGQASWEDADEAPGPAVIVGSDVYFRFVVTNTGNVALESITLEDDTYDLSGCAGQIVDPLAPGAWFECIVGPLAAEEGQHLNLATARGEFGAVSYDDTDEAQYVGLAADVLVSKSAAVEWVRYYAWDIAKSVDRGEIALVLPSDSSSVGDVVTYTIVASRSVVADQYTVSGVVSLVNQGSGVAEVSSLVDQLQMSTDGGATWVAVAEEVMLAATEAPIVLNPGDPAVEFSYSFDLAPVEGAIYRNVAKVEYGTVLDEVIEPTLRAAGLATIVDPSVVVPVELPSVPDEEVNATALVSDVEAITSGGEGLTFAVRSVRVAGVEQADLVGPWAVSVGEDGTVVIVIVKEVEAERQGTWVLHNVARIEPEGPEAEADVVIQVEAGGPPTAVSLKAWAALGGASNVVHSWSTAFEQDILAFRVYRSGQADFATAVQVAQVGALGRAAEYQWSDTGLSAGTYYYWLVEVDGSGAEGQRFGPKSVVVGASGQRLDGWKVYLPLTLKPAR